MSKLLLLVMVLSSFYYSVYGRTCVCAQFTAAECDADTSGKCKWHEIEVSYGSVQGDNGICRSQKWLDCHYDPDCVILGNNPQDYKIDEIEDYDSKVDKDWPWDCESGDYHKHAISTKPYDILAKKAALNILRNNPEISASSAIIGKVLGFIIFGILIGIAICWKFGDNNKKKVVLNAPESYNTF